MKFIDNIKKRFNKKDFTNEEYKLAEEYIMADINNNMIEKDLLLRGLPLKQTKRVIEASNKLRKMANLKYDDHDKELKGGILDGIRRSKKDSRESSNS